MSNEPLCRKATLEDRIAQARYELDEEWRHVTFWQRREAWEYAEEIRVIFVVPAELRLNALLERQRYEKRRKAQRYQETRQSIIDGVLARLGA